MNTRQEKDPKVDDVIKRKLEIVNQIRELKAESRKLDLELVRTGDNALAALAVVVCW